MGGTALVSEQTAERSASPPFGVAAIESAVSGGLAGVPLGVLAFFLAAPFQTHTWPGHLDSSLTYGPPFGASAGAALSVGCASARYPSRRAVRQLTRFVTGLLSLLVGTVVSVSLSQFLDGQLPHPRRTIELLLRGARGCPLDTFAVLSLSLGGGLTIAGAAIEKGHRSVLLLTLITASAMACFLSWGVVIRSGELGPVLPIALTFNVLGLVVFAIGRLAAPMGRLIGTAIHPLDHTSAGSIDSANSSVGNRR